MSASADASFAVSLAGSLFFNVSVDAARGRFFARFETRFQLAWVVGALAPVVLQSSTRTGITVLTVVFAVALAACLAGVSIEGSLARRLGGLLGRPGETRAPR